MAATRYQFSEDMRPRQTGFRCCDQPGCMAEGHFRAPRSRASVHEVGTYYWFCLEHVRAYNAAWNYYAGMSEQEIEAHLRQDTVWQRPSWPLGWRTAFARVSDPHHLFGAEEASPGTRKERRRRPASEEEKALAVFELEPPFTLIELKRRYKLLVKKHHPDANGGDKAAEERLKVITRAYALLKGQYFS